MSEHDNPNVEPHGFRVAVHLDDLMVKPLAQQLRITDYHKNVEGITKPVVMVIPAGNEEQAKELAEAVVKIALVLPRLFSGVAIERYAESDGDTLSRVWVV